MIEIICGREGFWGLVNKNLIPLGGAVTLKNATLAEHSFRTGGGRVKIGTPPAATAVVAAIDYFPTPSQQRIVAAFADGTIRKDNGSGGGWVTLASGLSMASAIPYFAIGGAESSGRNRKLFYADGINPPMYLDGDAAVMTTMNPVTQQAADWASSNPPSWFVIHQGFMWAGGCHSVGTAHTIYRSTTIGDHTDFRTAVTYSAPIYSGESERIVGAISYKGSGLLLFKFPDYVYFFDTASTTTNDWKPTRVAQPGGAGVYAMTLVEDDVMWVSQDGSVHLLSATQAYGSVRATDLSYKKLATWISENIELSVLNTSQIVYYSQKQEVMIACSQTGSTAKDRRLHMDLNRKADQGERWISWDRDRNEALFMRKTLGVLLPCYGDQNGQFWRLDHPTRSIEGDSAGYTFEWFLKDDDFSSVIPAWHGRKKNCRFIQLEYFPRTATTHVVEVYRDGQFKQSITLTLATTGAALGTSGATLPFMLGVSAIAMSIRRRMEGQCVRLALRGTTTGDNQDISITRILIGLDLAG